MKYMAEIELKSRWRNKLFIAISETRAKEEVDRYIVKLQQDYSRFKTEYEASKYAPFKPTGTYIIRPATAQEQIAYLLEGFAGSWDEFSVSGLASEIVEIVREEEEMV